MEEGEHSELDGLLKEQLSDPKVRQDWGVPASLAALVQPKSIGHAPSQAGSTPL